jgi:hypothetical protein
MMRLDVKMWVHALVMIIGGGHAPGSALDERVVELFQRTFACDQWARVMRLDASCIGGSLPSAVLR